MNECNEVVGRKRKKPGLNCGMDKVNLYFEIFDKEWKESALDEHGFAFRSDAMRCTEGTDAAAARAEPPNFSLFLDSLIGFTLYSLSLPRVLGVFGW